MGKILDFFKKINSDAVVDPKDLDDPVFKQAADDGFHIGKPMIGKAKKTRGFFRRF